MYVGLDTPRVIVAQLPSTNRSTPTCLLERGLMVEREERMSSSSLSLFDNTIHYYYQNKNHSILFVRLHTPYGYGGAD